MKTNKEPYKILLLGAGGQMGTTLTHLKWPEAVQLYPYFHQDMDLKNHQALEDIFHHHQWDFVINAAGLVKVDQAEHMGKEPYLVNGLGVLHLGGLCQKYGVPLLHYSTDYVFDGQKKEPYTEHDLPSPLNVYGLSKLFGETALQAYTEKHIILRTSWIYGLYGHNFLKMILKKSREQEKLSIVNDQIGIPTFSEDLGEATKIITLAVLKNPKFSSWGLYHYAGEGATNWYEYAHFILETCYGSEKAARILTPISTAQNLHFNPLVAARPSFSVLDGSRIKEVFSIKPKPWKERVGQVVHRYLAKNLWNSERI